MHVIAVIPTLNEASSISKLLEQMAGLSRPETMSFSVVVADCSSTDGTVEIASRYIGALESDLALSVLAGHWKNRAQAMNGGFGAQRMPITDQTIIWFVHADSVLHDRSLHEIGKLMASCPISGGGFRFRFQNEEKASQVTKIKLQSVALLNRLRYRLSGIYYGDQGIFIRASVFQQVGGFDDLPLMEDVHFCKKVRKIGKLRLAKLPMYTSPRRFLRHGVLKQSLVDIFLLFCDLMGFKPRQIHDWYNRVKS